MERMLPIRMLHAEPQRGALPPGVYCYGIALYLVSPTGDMDSWRMPDYWQAVLNDHCRTVPSSEMIPWQRIYELIAIGSNPRNAGEFLARDRGGPPVNITLDPYPESPAMEGAARPGPLRRG